MKAFNSLFHKLLVVTLTIGLLSACGGKEERKAKYLEKGKAYLAEKNYDKARIEFKNVLQIDPKDAKGYLFLGQVEEKRKDWAKAFGAYKKASELDPELIAARVRLANFYQAQAAISKAKKDETGAANALGLVQEQIKEIRERDPENAGLLALEAVLLVNDGDVENAVPKLENAIEREPDLEPAAILLSNLYNEAGRIKDAETVLIKAVEASSDPVVLQQRLAALYARNDKNDKAEEILRRVVDENPGEFSRWVGLISFLSRTNQIDEAEEVLNESIKVAPKDAQRYLLLTDFLALRKSNEVAIKKLQQLIKLRPDLPDLRLNLVKLYLTSKQVDEARLVLKALIGHQGTDPAGLRARVLLAQILAAENISDERVPTLLKEVLDENPRDNDALLLKGKLAVNNKDYTTAINNFRSVLKDQPNNAGLLQLLAVAHLGNKEKELALDTLRRGVENTPENPDLRLSLAQLLAQGDDIDSAIEQVDAVLKFNGHNLQALKSKLGLLARKGDAVGMDEVVKLMQKRAPDNEDGYILEARMRFAQKNYSAAIGLLDKVLAKNPESVEALIAKSDMLAGQKKYAEAIDVIDRLQEAFPDSAESDYRKGQLLAGQGDLVAAIAQYEAAFDKVPDSTKILVALVNLELKQGHDDKAEQRLLTILKENPEHKSVNGLLGVVYMAKKDFTMAETAFGRQLVINPRNGSAYSQLARARIGNGNLAGAVQAYQDGLKQLPGNTNLLVALAGIHERLKDYEVAIAIYEEILEKQPNNAISTNNLAVLLADYRTDEASLDRAVELSVKLEKTNQPAFWDTAGWAYYRKGDYGKAVEILERVVEKAPKVPVFQYHLGMTYYKQGNKVAAHKHLSKATSGEYTYQGVEEARATLESL